MNIIASKALRISLIYIINKKFNANYSITDISTIRFTLHMICIWMNDESRFDIKYDILNDIEIKF